jgi:hypothetical protein
MKDSGTLMGTGPLGIGIERGALSIERWCQGVLHALGIDGRFHLSGYTHTMMHEQNRNVAKSYSMLPP